MPTARELALAWAQVKQIRRWANAPGASLSVSSLVRGLVDGTDPLPDDLRVEVAALEEDLRCPKDVAGLQHALRDERRWARSDVERFGELRQELEKRLRCERDKYRELARAVGYLGDTNEHFDVVTGVEAVIRDLQRRARGVEEP